jgi:hypothetical protein
MLRSVLSGVPLVPFVSLVSFYYQDHQWQFDVTVSKTEAN